MRDPHFKPLLRLALPVVLGNLGIMLMGFVDLIFVGRVGSVDIGAIGVSHSLFSWGMVFGVGLQAGLEFLCAKAYGAGEFRKAEAYLGQGIRLALGVGVLLTVFLWGIAQGLPFFGLNPEILPKTQSVLQVMALSMVPVLGFTALRIFLQSRNQTAAVVWALVTANLVNAGLNAVLVPGLGPFPRLEAVGSAWATVVSRVWMLLFLVPPAWRATGGRLSWSPVPERMREVLKIGVPAGLQMIFEMGVFALATALAGKLDARQMAAHQVVLNLASLAFMVPLGIGSAGAVLVGQALGAQRPERAIRIGWLALGLALAFNVFSAGAFVVGAVPLLTLYTTDPAVLGIALQLLGYAALFQVSDGAQAVATGILRGAGDTRSAALANGVGHWLIGLPLGVGLCFFFEWGVRGLWIGLSLGLTGVALALVWQWWRMTGPRGLALREDQL